MGEVLATDQDESLDNRTQSNQIAKSWVVYECLFRLAILVVHPHDDGGACNQAHDYGDHGHDVGANGLLRGDGE